MDRPGKPKKKKMRSAEEYAKSDANLMWDDDYEKNR